MTDEPSHIDAVVTHHLDGFRSGVARFNELLASRVGVPLIPLSELGRDRRRPLMPLLSFKLSELDADARRAVDDLCGTETRWDVFLHEQIGDELETRLVAGARRVFCGNAEIGEVVRAQRPDADVVWTPGLLSDDRPFPVTAFSVFSFGMAHKLRIDMFCRLRELLDASGTTYAVYVSAANHETTTLADAESVFSDLHAVFPDELWFLGNLSDVAVASWIGRSTFFAAFFPRGARANNTSVAAAMERGAVVLTNLDSHSPPWLRHMDTVIDVTQCDSLSLSTEVLAGIAARAEAAVRGLGWEELVAEITGADPIG